MKKNVFLSILILNVIFIACEKENTIIDQSQLKNSELNFELNEPADLDSASTSFTLLDAGISGNDLYTTLCYTGGNKAHEFNITWDGKIKYEHQRKLAEVYIYHLTSDDDGLQTVYDSLSIAAEEIDNALDYNLDSLFSFQELLLDSAYKIKVINALDTANNVVIYPVFNHFSNDTIYSDTCSYDYNYELRVVKTPCENTGVWKNYWLQSNSSDSVYFFLPMHIEDSISYVPQENDLLKVNMDFMSDSISIDSICRDIWEQEFSFITIKEIKLSNQY